MNTITNTLYQSSEYSTSLLFSCPQLTEEFCPLLAAAARTWLLLHYSHYAISFCLVESIPQLLELWPISMHFDGPSSFTLLYRNATSCGIILPCLKLKNFNSPNHVYINFKCQYSKIWNSTKGEECNPHSPCFTSPYWKNTNTMSLIHYTAAYMKVTNPFTSWMEYSKLEEHLWWI